MQLHKLFLSRFSKFVFIVEECLQRRVIPNLPCMFVRGTDFKVRTRPSLVGTLPEIVTFQG